MQVTNVSVDKIHDGQKGLLAICSLVLDSKLTIHDVKIVRLADGSTMVILPVRQITAHCLACGYSNRLKVTFCNRCGKPFRHNLKSDVVSQDVLTTTPELRQSMRRAVLDAYLAAIRSPVV